MNKTAMVVAGLAAGALATLYGWFRPQPQPGPAPAAAAAAPATGSPAPVAREFDFEISQARIAGPPALAVTQGERVTLRVRSDVADELHVHGYDLSAPLPAGEVVALTFIAASAGRFEVELHKAHREIGALEVQPRP
jgi:FtsP/CotA-like multicopper oxidase with cupredoxin domain